MESSHVFTFGTAGQDLNSVRAHLG